MLMRLRWYFTRRIAATNTFLSLLVVVAMQAARYLYSGRPPDLGSALTQFAAAALTAGFTLSCYIYSLFRRHEWPMYRNHGLRPSSCLGIAYLFHVTVCVPVLALGMVLGSGAPT